MFEGTSAHLRKKNSGTFENGGVWRCFSEAAKVRGIEVRYENPAFVLVQDPVTREVSDVVATDAEGNEYTIKSGKGRFAGLRRLREQPRDAARLPRHGCRLHRRHPPATPATASRC